LNSKTDQAYTPLGSSDNVAHPATVDGKPVASEAEVIFPFNSSYPNQQFVGIQALDDRPDSAFSAVLAGWNFR
jgi:hypothetical protein